MVDLGDGARADQVLDEAGEGGDIGHATEDGCRARKVQLERVVAVPAANAQGYLSTMSNVPRLPARTE